MIHKIRTLTVFNKINNKFYVNLSQVPFNFFIGLEVNRIRGFLYAGIISLASFNIHQIHLKMLERQQKAKHESR